MPRVVVARAAGGRRKGASPKVEFRLTPEREVFGKIICQELGFYKGVDNFTPGKPIILLPVRREYLAARKRKCKSPAQWIWEMMLLSFMATFKLHLKKVATNCKKGESILGLACA